MISRNYIKQIFPTMAGSMSILTASYNIAIISVALSPIKNYMSLNGTEVTLLASAILLGAVFGAFFSGIFSDRFGRIGILTLDLMTFVVAGIASALVSNFLEIFTLRLIVGIGVGMDYVVVFAYISEIEHRSHSRGKRLVTVMFFANFGILLAYLLGGIILLKLGPTGWRLTLATGSILSMFSILMRLRLRESELWKLSRLGSIREILAKTFLKHNRKDVFRFSVPWFLYQISDQSLTLFLPVILIPYIGASFSGGALGAVLVKIFTIPASFLTIIFIDRLGRNFLQSLGFLLRSILLGLLGVVLYMGIHIAAFVIIGMLGGSFFFGALGPDKTTVTSPAQSYPTEIRGTGQGISEAFGRIGGFVGVLGFGAFSLIGAGVGLIFLSLTCMLGFIFTVLFIGWRVESTSIENA
ncbi:MFS transporter [Oxyplasma meridianum]|uniref:MFS transporter n=1 Tax=Oxyplasma meridianum TaxID=3073602 RepID=A0AAX4NDM4_9ARCH